MFALLRNEKGVMLISICILACVLATTMTAFFWAAFTEVRATEGILNTTQAFYLAEEGIDRALFDLGNNGSGNVSDTNSYGTYVVSISAGPGTGQTTLTSMGTTLGVSRVVTAVAQDVPDIVAAVKANGDVLTLGNFTVDGRDHDANGNLLDANGDIDDPNDDVPASDGVIGISATGDINCGGSSQAGGEGFAPEGGLNPPGCEPNNGDPLPDTPEEILEVEEDYFDGVTKCGDPDDLPAPGDPDYTPGIYYLNATSWNDLNFDALEQPAILVVHSGDPANPAQLRNPSGTFRGIIVADEIYQLTGQTQIIGCVFSRVSEHKLGTGHADILYSSAVIQQLNDMGLGVPSKLTITSWKDGSNE